MKLCALLLILLFTRQAMADQEFAGIHPEELSLGGIKLGEKESETIRHLGKPVRVVKDSDGNTYFYRGLTIRFNSDGVYDIKSERSKFCTPQKICPGMSIQRLQAAYGKPIHANRDNGNFLEYLGTNDQCWLQISENGNLIKTMRVACQP